MPTNMGVEKEHRYKRANRKKQMRPYYDGESLRGALREYSREPFIDILAEFMQSFPDAEAVQKFAAEKPDRFINSMRQLQHMAGYVDKKESETNINVTIGKMSDADLRDKLKGLGERLGILPEPVDVTPKTSEIASEKSED